MTITFFARRTADTPFEARLARLLETLELEPGAANARPAALARRLARTAERAEADRVAAARRVPRWELRHAHADCVRGLALRRDGVRELAAAVVAEGDAEAAASLDRATALLSEADELRRAWQAAAERLASRAAFPAPSWITRLP